MAAVTICSDFGAQTNKSLTLFPHLFPMKWWDQMPWSSFSECCVQLFETPWTVAYQAPPPMEFSRPEYWSGLSFPSPRDFPTQRSNLGLLHCRQTLYHLSHLATPWTMVCQDPLSMGFSRQEYWSGMPFPSPGDLPNAGIEPRSPALQADSLPAEPQGKL